MTVGALIKQLATGGLQSQHALNNSVCRVRKQNILAASQEVMRHRIQVSCKYNPSYHVTGIGNDEGKLRWPRLSAEVMHKHIARKSWKYIQRSPGIKSQHTMRQRCQRQQAQQLVCSYSTSAYLFSSSSPHSSGLCCWLA